MCTYNVIKTIFILFSISVELNYIGGVLKLLQKTVVDDSTFVG